MKNNQAKPSADPIAQAYVENLMNSPLVSLNDDGTESHLTTCPLFFVRQARAPVADFSAEAGLFGQMFEKLNDPAEQEWCKKRLFQYEQYFARLEIMNLVWTEEARFRQLIRRHLAPDTALKPMLEDLNMFSESEYILDNAFSLVRKIIKSDNAQDEQSQEIIRAAEKCFGKIEAHFLKPILQIRHGISHGNMRSFVILKGVSVPRLGQTENNEIVRRALDIYKNADAVAVRALQEGFHQAFTPLTYMILLKKTPAEIRNAILEFARRMKMIRGASHADYPFHWKVNLRKEVNAFSSKALQQACLAPPIAVRKLIRDLERFL